MGQLILDISISLDGFAAGPDASMDDPLGKGGEQLHEWAFATRAFRSRHGMEGGDDGPDSRMVDELLDRVGATIMGRRMYSGGSGPWEQDGNAGGWWGDDPPFRHPVFVLTHHVREPLEMRGGTTFFFVTEGIERALELAREAAGELDVQIGGGADVAQQYLRAGLTDEVRLHVAPVFLGSGRRLFEDMEPGLRLVRTGALESPGGAVHLAYRAANVRA